ncbi:hypothetical protein Hanom_Chr02g00171841 [Helianthus anomalus]
MVCHLPSLRFPLFITSDNIVGVFSVEVVVLVVVVVVAVVMVVFSEEIGSSSSNVLVISLKSQSVK